jgi:predicted HAD superfamily Cof-like phosphohydrolase
MSAFKKDIEEFNKMYRLPVNDVPTALFATRAELIERLGKFKDILTEELDEMDEIVQKINVGDEPAEVLTSLADLLGDIQVYCASEMAKFGLDNDLVLATIMASNMSKLGVDGQPIYDARGKVMKGPNYWKPEPMIRRAIDAAIRLDKRAKEG